MQRNFRFDPQAFPEILTLGGCRTGHSNADLCFVSNPKQPGRNTVVRLKEAVTNKEIESHLWNLSIEEVEFLAWHERVMTLIR